MAADSELIIALNRHLEALPDAPPIAWENVPFNQDGDTFLEQNYLPAETIAVGIEQGGGDVRAGIYQIIVNTPKDRGWAENLTITEAIYTHFARSTTLSEGSTRVVIHKVWNNTPLVDESYYRIPVSIRVRGV